MDNDDEQMSATIAFVALVVLLVVAATAAAQTVVAEYVGAAGYPRITLYDTPCSGQAAAVVAQHVRREYHSRFKGATSQFRARDNSVRTYGACWARLDPPEAIESIYVVLFEDHEVVTLTVRDFIDHRPEKRKVRNVTS